jgi:malonate decarboxylase beta subunit
VKHNRNLLNSFIELDARERARAILDLGTFRELLDPFQRIESRHLMIQGIVPQSDDGVVVAKGMIEKQPAVVISVDGRFQGGAIGEVSGAKIAGALELALRDNRNGIPTRAALLVESGGVRLQEGNYGLLAIAEIQAAIVELRRYQPVVCVIAGMIGCFGGMSITAGLCSEIIMTRQGRLQLNGPEVIEQEAGIQELDSKNRRLIWSMTGGEQRVETDLADTLVHDDIEEVQQAIRAGFQSARMDMHRSSDVDKFLSRLAEVNAVEQPHLKREHPIRSGAQDELPSRGRTFFHKLTEGFPSPQDKSSTILSAESIIGNEIVQYVAVVPLSSNRFYRARSGEVGLEEGWNIARCVRQIIAEDKFRVKRAIVAIVDVPSQAYGYHEELHGIHLSCAAAVDAYATARLMGHPVIALVVGQAISGAFLAHGLQANRIIALDDPNVTLQVMSKQSAARITRRSIEELDEIARKIPATAYDIRSFATLGALHHLIGGMDADQPSSSDIDEVKIAILQAIKDVRNSVNDLSCRLQSKEAQDSRSLSILVRTKLVEQWK